MDSSKLPITGPCPIDLDAIGFDRTSKVSHCTHCEKSVHNLSTMTEADARAFLRERAGQKICVTYARDKEGVVQFQPDPQVVPLARLTRRSAAAAAGIGLAAALAACTPHGDEVQGKIEPRQEQLAGEAMPVEPIEVPAGGMVAPDLDPDDKEPCNKDDREPLEVVEGKMPIEEIDAPQPALAGAMKVPEPDAMVDGEMEVPPQAPPARKKIELETVDGQMPIPD